MEKLPTGVAGVDEAGRGPLAGPVCAAAVILPDDHGLLLRDSKKLSPNARLLLSGQIKEIACSWAVAFASVEEIDQYNILQATFMAMRRAVFALTPVPSDAWIDGNQMPRLEGVIVTPCVKGDDRFDGIAAASILAKVARDQLMDELALTYPEYEFLRHKGYPTPLHLEKLRQYGASPIHRRTFAPVRAVLIC
ncbi:MAG: ribonuclease HII, partial [Pseudomonadota bacterium]